MSKDTTTTDKLRDALAVIALDSRSRAWLHANDPQALKQADAALKQAGINPDPGWPTIADQLRALGLASSRSEAVRLIDQGAVRVNGREVWFASVPGADDGDVVTVGKRRRVTLGTVPAAACPRCGGWTATGGMSQFADSDQPIQGRTGCVCK